MRLRDSKLRDIPVIVTSSLEGVANVIRCLELGAYDYLHKPMHRVAEGAHQQEAGRGILMDGETRGALADEVVALEELGEVLFRGKAVAVAVFAVHG